MAGVLTMRPQFCGHQQLKRILTADLSQDMCLDAFIALAARSIGPAVPVESSLARPSARCLRRPSLALVTISRQPEEAPTLILPVAARYHDCRWSVPSSGSPLVNTSLFVLSRSCAHFSRKNAGIFLGAITRFKPSDEGESNRTADGNRWTVECCSQKEELTLDEQMTVSGLSLDSFFYGFFIGILGLHTE